MVSVRQTSEATHKEVSQFKYSQQWFRATKFIEHGLQKPVGYGRCRGEYFITVKPSH